MSSSQREADRLGTEAPHELGLLDGSLARPQLRSTKATSNLICMAVLASDEQPLNLAPRISFSRAKNAGWSKSGSGRLPVPIRVTRHSTREPISSLRPRYIAEKIGPDVAVETFAPFGATLGHREAQETFADSALRLRQRAGGPPPRSLRGNRGTRPACRRLPFPSASAAACSSRSGCGESRRKSSSSSFQSERFSRARRSSRCLRQRASRTSESSQSLSKKYRVESASPCCRSRGLSKTRWTPSISHSSWATSHWAAGSSRRSGDEGLESDAGVVRDGFGVVGEALRTAPPDRWAVRSGGVSKEAERGSTKSFSNALRHGPTAGP